VITRATALSLESATPIAPGFEALAFKASRGIEDIYELTKVRKDGSRFPAVVSVTALRDAQNRIIGYLFIGTDNTARRQVEDERKRAEEALRQSEERFRAFVAASSDEVYRMSPDWSELRQLRGRNFIVDTEKPSGAWLQEYIHPDDQPRVVAVINEAIRTKSTFELEHLVRRADGTLGWTFSRAIPLTDAKGEIVEWFGAASDITGRKQAEDEIRRLNETLEERVTQRTAELQSVNEELGTFSYSVSHDLRAPLRQIMGFVKILQEDVGLSLSEESLLHLATIFKSATRMGNLIDDLLAFARVGRVELRKTNINLDELAREALGDFEKETKERNIAWNIHPLPSVRADRDLLQMVLINLISNAVKFTGARAEAKIEIGATPGDNDETVIFIRDNGAGFNPLYADKLFGAFQRLHSQAEFEGTGIGLANVQRIIHRHGGRSWAEGVVDGGATLYFSIPKQNEGLNRQ
jgi:signal transduction histidine kinase